MDERTCPSYRPGKRTAEGLVCCGGFHHWKDLEARVVGWSWEWLCPECGGMVKKDPWNPPRDMSFTCSQPEARTPQVESGGMSTRKAVWSVR